MLWNTFPGLPYSWFQDHLRSKTLPVSHPKRLLPGLRQPFFLELIVVNCLTLLLPVGKTAIPWPYLNVFYFLNVPLPVKYITVHEDQSTSVGHISSHKVLPKLVVVCSQMLLIEYFTVFRSCSWFLPLQAQFWYLENTFHIAALQFPALISHYAHVLRVLLLPICNIPSPMTPS